MWMLVVGRWMLDVETPNAEGRRTDTSLRRLACPPKSLGEGEYATPDAAYNAATTAGLPLRDSAVSRFDVRYSFRRRPTSVVTATIQLPE